MRTLALVLAFTAGAALPLGAQGLSGGANRNAPKITSTIEFANQVSLTIQYVSLNFAQGRFMDRLKDAGQRANQNKQAESAPLGSMKVSGDLTIGGKSVAAGEYKLYFTIDDDLKWHLVVSNESDDGDETKIDWTLDLKETSKTAQRLAITVAAAAKSDECQVNISFGTMSGSIDGKVGEAAEASSKRGGDR